MDMKSILGKLKISDSTRRRDSVGGYIIDTCDTIDNGWETAIWKEELTASKGLSHIYIVGNYPNVESARNGHEVWVALAATGLSLDELEEADRS
jgi:hypothetical protein